MPAQEKNRQRNLDNLITLVSDFYWERDATGRFTCLEGPMTDIEAIDCQSWVGKTPDEVGFGMGTEGRWPGRDAMAEVSAGFFRDHLASLELDDGTVRHFRLNGELVVDEDGRHAGIHGFGKDITEEKEQQDELRQFRAAMDASQDMIFIVERASMKFVYVNEMACRLTGYDKEALLLMPPYQLLLADPDELERDYNQVIKPGY